MVSGVDIGAILGQHLFDISAQDTALTLNTHCFEAAIDNFPAALTALEANAPGVGQELSSRSEYRRADYPAAVRLTGLMALAGDAVCARLLGVTQLDSPGAQDPAITAATAQAAQVDGAMRRALAGIAPLDMPQIGAADLPDWQSLPLAAPIFDSALVWQGHWRRMC